MCLPPLLSPLPPLPPSDSPPPSSSSSSVLLPRQPSAAISYFGGPLSQGSETLNPILSQSPLAFRVLRSSSLVQSIRPISFNASHSGVWLTMRDLLVWVESNLIKERPEMFMKGDSVRPGVLVLINDCDWELCGSLDTELEEKDNVVFISTLHGG
ncbi:hypothetical protein C4D60_Mb04t18560 [Musa balbisiana]|uniref:Ubiquitin-related modifier 1 homolog n=1 Tax=Musa balbisiana TaxID=52838 RepID=A0A4S8KD05_MUSBA|nr:hypothetical protein C4D60_Mb04t18560 [Musa balbisiana]